MRTRQPAALLLGEAQAAAVGRLEQDDGPRRAELEPDERGRAGSAWHRLLGPGAVRGARGQDDRAVRRCERNTRQAVGSYGEQ